MITFVSGVINLFFYKTNLPAIVTVIKNKFWIPVLAFEFKLSVYNQILMRIYSFQTVFFMKGVIINFLQLYV